MQFDNDTYYLTDYYYTYGLTVGLGNPVFTKVPWKGIFPKFRQNSTDYSQVSLSQKLYTPKNIRDTLVQFNDRPFSATLELSQTYTSYDSVRGIIVKSKIRIGVLGPAAGGELLQTKIHEWINSPDPGGWKYQIQNAIILNYDFGISYPLYSNKFIRFSGEGTLRAGTLNDDVETGVNLIIGNHNLTRKRKFGCWFRIYGAGKFVMYNATLQGGFFSNNEHDLSWKQITPVVFMGNAELGVFYKGISLQYTHQYLSKEFDAGIDHNYGSFLLVIDL